jgi:hypothetical protein
MICFGQMNTNEVFKQRLQIINNQVVQRHYSTSNQNKQYLGMMETGERKKRFEEKRREKVQRRKN